LAAGNPAKVLKKINRDFEWWKELKYDRNRKIQIRKHKFLKGLPLFIKNPLKKVLFYFR